MHFGQILTLLLVMLLTNACVLSSPENPLVQTALISDSLTERLSVAVENGASGILRITQNGEVLYESGFGSSSCNVDEEITASHIFMIGSITKELTRILGFILEEKEVLSFDRTIADFIPSFSGELGQVTVGQLLNHTGGVPDFIDELGRPIQYYTEYDYTPVSRNELLERANLAELIFEPGEREKYSNLGFQLLAAVYEIATGESYQVLLEKLVFKPAGMTDTGFWFADNVSHQFVDGCRIGDLHWGNPIDDLMWNSDGPSWNLLGAGGLLSSAESLGKFFEGIGNGVYFQNKAQHERYIAERMVYSEDRQQYVMSPMGSNRVFNAVAFWANRSHFNVVLMTNRRGDQVENQLQLFRDILSFFPSSEFIMAEE